MYLGHVKFYKAYKDKSLTVASLVRTTEVVSTSRLTIVSREAKKK